MPRNLFSHRKAAKGAEKNKKYELCGLRGFAVNSYILQILFKIRL